MNNEQVNKICSICGEENDEVFHTLKCGHSFHYQCLLLSFKNMKNNYCPYCRSNKNYLPVINGVKKIFPNIHNVDDNYISSYHIKKCEHILTRGKNKGAKCTKNCNLGYNFCSIHCKNN